MNGSPVDGGLTISAGAPRKAIRQPAIGGNVDVVKFGSSARTLSVEIGHGQSFPRKTYLSAGNLMNWSTADADK